MKTIVRLCVFFTMFAGATAFAERPVPGPKADYPTSWTDARVVEGLAKSCKFDPGALPKAQRIKLYGEAGKLGSYDDLFDPLSCKGDIFEQSCVYDPCFSKGEEECKPACIKDCGKCAGGCVKECGTCAAACKDAACHAACAKSCGECRQGCVTGRDRCATAHCTEVYKACEVDLYAKWTKNNCAALCDKYLACSNNCDGPSCRNKCVPKGASACELEMCHEPPRDPAKQPPPE